MRQFTPQEQAMLIQRARQQPRIIQRLITDNDVVLNHPLCVPQTGIATWGHYYFCPQHGVRLQWERDSPETHQCPVDKQKFTGEPYHGAWWRMMNGHNCRASYQLGLLWLLTQEARYAQRVRQILLAYARYYPAYEVHGGIPCNGPGKMNIQTLCEANCLLELAKGYDLIRATLTRRQQRFIESRLLRPGAEFLCQHRENQLHNHEVKVNTAIAVLGLLLDDASLVDFAVNEPYGLRWQLQQGLYTEGLWFEGSAHYHFYVLQGYFDWEKFARGTAWSLMAENLYERMLDFPLNLLTPDGTFPFINDAVSGQNTLHHDDIYEFAFKHYRKPAYAAALKRIYQHQSRDNLDAFLYGVDDLPEDVALSSENVVHAPDGGLTLIRQPAHNHALLVKHMPFSGEHDHHDYLAVTLWMKSHAVLPDLGTTGYGADLHRDYYKNSATHNTLSVNLTNAPPARPQTRWIRRTPDTLHLACYVDWYNKPPPLPSFSLTEWDDAAWRDIAFHRHFIIHDGLIFDVARISNPHRQALYWTLHVDGTPNAAYPGRAARLGGPLMRLKNVVCSPLTGTVTRRYDTPAGGFTLWLASQGTLYEGDGPANPAISDLRYLVNHSDAPHMNIVGCYCLDSQAEIEKLSVRWEEACCEIAYQRCGQQQSLTINV